MDENLAVALGWAVASIALFSFLGVRAWVNAQQREREAYYKSEAIKKVAEMQGTAPEAMLDLLREALRSPTPTPQLISNAHAREFYRSETLKRMAEMKGDASTVLAVMREDEHRAARRVREGLKLAGLILAGVGAGLVVFLRAIVPDMPVFLVGLIPLLVGGALLSYAFVFAPGE
jgi:hypothetical protein